MERLNWFYFLGLNRRGHDGADIHVRAVGSVLAGTAAVRPRDDRHPIRTVGDDSRHARASPKGMSLRNALRMAKVYAASDPAVGPLVELALKRHYMPMATP